MGPTGGSPRPWTVSSSRPPSTSAMSSTSTPPQSSSAPSPSPSSSRSRPSASPPPKPLPSPRPPWSWSPSTPRATRSPSAAPRRCDVLPPLMSTIHFPLSTFFSLMLSGALLRHPPHPSLRPPLGPRRAHSQLEPPADLVHRPHVRGRYPPRLHRRAGGPAHRPHHLQPR